MKRHTLTLLLLAIFMSCSTESQVDENLATDPSDQSGTEDSAPSESESDYYTSPRSYAVIYNLQSDYGVDSSFATDDSAALQQAIDDAAAAGGGKIVIPEGNYSLAGILLKSDIHIEISSSATIRPTELSANSNKNYAIFTAKSEAAEPLENISIGSYGGDKFTFDLRYLSDGFENVRCILFSNVYNFEISDILIEDNETVFAAIDFTGENIDNVIYGPTKGVVKDLENYNSEYGYGLIQVQFGRDMLFKNLYSLGGATLRLESHLTTYYQTDCIEYIARIVGREITCENGHAAVMLSPHFVENSWVDVRGMEGIACESTLLIEGGFVSDDEAALGLTPGHFTAESTFREIKSTFSATDAQVHPKHYQYMVDELYDLLPSTSPWEAKSGPSIAVIMHTADYSADYTTDDIESAEGFLDS
ncbi:MAG: glycosyl hydrolase family 28-related protein, partial [Rikenellaceae bacterium]